MQKSGLSRLLVLDESGRLTGVLGIADIIVRGPGRTAIGIARGIYARETAIKSKNLPRPAESPTPEFFRGRRDTSALQPGSDTSPNAARLEAEHVVRGGVNELKEFPS
jgi:CBS domain-containing protein